MHSNSFALITQILFIDCDTSILLQERRYRNTISLDKTNRQLDRDDKISCTHEEGWQYVHFIATTIPIP